MFHDVRPLEPKYEDRLQSGMLQVGDFQKLPKHLLHVRLRSLTTGFQTVVIALGQPELNGALILFISYKAVRRHLAFDCCC